MQKLLIAIFAMFLTLSPALSKETKSQQNQFLCLAQNVYYEAGSEDYSTKLAVAYVTLNRVYSHQYPNTICGVVFQACQFVWHCEDITHKPYGKNWEDSIEAANCALNNCSPNPVPNVFYFHDKRIKFAFRSKKVDIILKTDNMVFYKYKKDK